MRIFQKKSAAFWLLLPSFVSAEIDPDSCNKGSYYASLSDNPTQWTRREIANVIKTTHKEVVTYSNKPLGDGDVWEALTKLDPGTVADTVHLTFVNEDVPVIPFAGTRGWQKGHFWPTDRGIGLTGPDISDLHSIRPVKLSVNDIRDTKFFGQCEVLEKPDACQSPAPGGASDTCVCNRVFEPPEIYRGVIARALMYMDLRYDGSEPDTVDLRLTDCPFNFNTDMGYLSQMLEWHNQYPPTQEERQRTRQVCTNYQGNRNPFIDFPELATAIYGNPLPQPEAGREIYSICENIPTPAPTFTPNECENIQAGDIWPFILNSEEPENVGWYPLIDIPGGMDLFITDNPWDGTQFLTGEGIRKFTVPEDGIDASTVFGYGEGIKYGTEWKNVEGLFSLSTEGDQVFLMCIGAGGNFVPLSGINYNGNWTESGLSTYNLDESALPDRLIDGGTIALPHFNNYIFDIGMQTLTDENLKKELSNVNNWKGVDVGRVQLDNGDDNSQGGSSGGTSNTSRLLLLLTTTTTTIIISLFLSK